MGRDNVKVFISWSGDRSKLVALALRDWLPRVIQCLDPFMSSRDIDKGAMPIPEIIQHLRKAKVGIVCLTPENKSANWPVFEAGVIAADERNHVQTLLLDLTHADVVGPFQNFQHTLVEKDEIFSLLESINKKLRPPRKLERETLRGVFDGCWPDLKRSLDEIPNLTDDHGFEVDTRGMGEKIDEIVEHVRGLSLLSRRNLDNVPVDVHCFAGPGPWQNILRVANILGTSSVSLDELKEKASQICTSINKRFNLSSKYRPSPEISGAEFKLDLSEDGSVSIADVANFVHHQVPYCTIEPQ